MTLHPGNIQGYNNEIQIAGSDAAIGHNPGINEAGSFASKGDKAFQGNIASPTGTVHKVPQPSQNKTRVRVPTAMANAHKFSTSQVAVFPNVPRGQETMEPIIPDRADSALPAKYPGHARGPAAVFLPTLSNRSCQVAWEPAPAHFSRRR